MCGDCWLERNPECLPVRVLGGLPGVCCFCGVASRLGIWIRFNPRSLSFCDHSDSDESKEDAKGSEVSEVRAKAFDEAALALETEAAEWGGGDKCTLLRKMAAAIRALGCASGASSEPKP